MGACVQAGPCVPTRPVSLGLNASQRKSLIISSLCYPRDGKGAITSTGAQRQGHCPTAGESTNGTLPQSAFTGWTKNLKMLMAFHSVHFTS